MRLDNICKEYERSEITVVFFHDKQRKKYINIFSVAEMCPIEQEESDKIIDGKYNCKKKTINKFKDIYISRMFSNNSKDSLNFFRGNGNIRTIDIDEKINIESFPNALEQEPKHEVPLLVDKSSYKNYDILNILPYRKLPVYICSLIDVYNETKSLFTDKEFIDVCEFILDVLGIDLLKYNEYFGSILLCMPNYILRDVNISISKSQHELLVSFLERKDKSILEGRIELIDERINGIVPINNIKITSKQMLINIPYFPNKLRVRLFDSNDDLIYESSSSFIKSINMDIGIKDNTLKINAIDKDRKEKVIEIDKVTYNQFNIGEKTTYGAENKLIDMKRNRELDKLEEERSFIYFPGKNSESKIKAQKIIRELISKAREECIICDPYLSAKDVLDFAIRVETKGVKIKLISSAAFLNRKVENDKSRKEGYKLYNVINQLNNQNIGNEIVCHVLKGRKKSPLHDRFIVIDKNVYILGSSLNEFGSRATTLFKVPNPKVLINQANVWFNDEEESLSIDKWISNIMDKGEEK